MRHGGRRPSRRQMILDLTAIVQPDGQRQQDDAADTAVPVGMGILTTANRRLWAQWRHQLLQGVPALFLFPFQCAAHPLLYSLRLIHRFKPHNDVHFGRP